MSPRHPVPALLLAALPFLVGSAMAQEPGSPVRGLEYAVTHCAECHAYDFDDYDSPLYEAPSFMEIANSGEMSEIALMPFFQTSHETMPNLVIPADSIHDLTAYILSLKE
jgi:mono/diheme cytochrome c family protein